MGPIFQFPTASSTDLGAGKRCTNHKLRNLLAKAPAHLREELAKITGA